MSRRILIIEDDADIGSLVAMHLRDNGYDVDISTSGDAGLARYKTGNYSLVILDLMLPVMDGLAVCRAIRAERNYTPILMLTAKSTELDRVLGLEMGADDYMTKPFSMRELLARVKAMLRRERLIREEVAAEADEVTVPADKKQTHLEFHDLVIDLVRREVRLQGQPIRLKPKEYDLLVFLARNQGIALSRDLILERVWGWEHHGGSRTVDVHVRWLRAKIEPDPAEAQRIVTVRGMGYRFEG